MPTGGGAAYSQLTKSEDYLGQAIKGNKDAAAKVKADKLLADERESVRKSAEEKANEAAKQTAYNKLANPPDGWSMGKTGHVGYDNMLDEYVRETSTQYGEWGRKGTEAYDRGDMVVFREAEAMQAKIKTNFNLVKESALVTKAKIDEFTKIAPNVSEVDEEYIAQMQGLLDEDYRIFNENGVPYIEMVIKNKAGEEKYVRSSLQDFNKNELPYMRFDITDSEKGWVNMFASKQKLAVTKTEDGLYNVNVTRWSPRNEAALVSEMDRIIKDKKKMSSALYQAEGIKKKGLEATDYREGDEFEDGDKEKVKEYLREQVMGRVENKYEKTTDAGAASRAAAGDKETKVYHAEAVTDASGNILGLEQKADNKGNTVRIGKQYTFKNNKGGLMKGIDSDNSDAVLLSATLTEDGRLIGEFQKSSKTNKKIGEDGKLFNDEDGGKETATQTKTYRKYLEEPEASRLATSTPTATNLKELVEYLESRDQGGNTSGKTKIEW